MDPLPVIDVGLVRIGVINVLLLEIIVGIIFLIFFLYLLILGIEMPEYGQFWVSPGAFPVILNILLLLLSLWWVIAQIINLREKKELKNQVVKLSALFSAKEEWKRLVLISVLTLAYIYWLTPLLGFSIATVVFLTISLKLFGKINWLKCTGVGVLITILIYLAFRYVLNLPMPT